jgi:hypothetical protein
LRQEAQGMGAAGATTSVPGRAGEATTMVRGRPNANTEQPRLPMRSYSGVGVPATCRTTARRCLKAARRSKADAQVAHDESPEPSVVQGFFCVAGAGGQAR